MSERSSATWYLLTWKTIASVDIFSSFKMYLLKKKNIYLGFGLDFSPFFIQSPSGKICVKSEIEFVKKKFKNLGFQNL